MRSLPLGAPNLLTHIKVAFVLTGHLPDSGYFLFTKNNKQFLRFRTVLLDPY